MTSLITTVWYLLQAVIVLSVLSSSFKLPAMLSYAMQ